MARLGCWKMASSLPCFLLLLLSGVRGSITEGCKLAYLSYRTDSCVIVSHTFHCFFFFFFFFFLGKLPKFLLFGPSFRKPARKASSGVTEVPYSLLYISLYNSESFTSLHYSEPFHSLCYCVIHSLYCTIVGHSFTCPTVSYSFSVLYSVSLISMHYS